jgi:hypothetical protein
MMILRHLAPVAVLAAYLSSIAVCYAKPTPDDSNSATTPSPTPNEPDANDMGSQFKHFTAYSSSMTCDADEHALPFNNQIRGVNLGGWLGESLHLL